MRTLAPCLIFYSITGTVFAATWPFDMRVERIQPFTTGFRVITTGAIIDLDAAAGQIAISQRIACKRSLGRVGLDLSALAGLRMISEAERQLAFETDGGLRLEVHCESVIRLDCSRAMQVSLFTVFDPEHVVNTREAALLLDEHGGLGVYPLFPEAPRAALRRAAGRVTVTHDVPPGGTLLICACPPREYNWQQHREERIVHQFPRELQPGLSDRPLPTDEELVAWRGMGNILVLHLEFWDGFGIPHITPRDPVRFRQVVDLAHRLGYLVLPYSSTFYYGPAARPGGGWRDDAVDLYMEEARWLLSEYGVDGLYWDGVFTDVLKAWECARRMRDLLGTRRLYVHATTTPLLGTDVHVPFVDTWADYLLRGEGIPRGRIDPIYLRYVASGYNISNSIGELCYETCRVDREMFDWALQANVRIPFWPGLQTHGGKDYFLHPEEDKLFREYYLPATERVTGAADYAALADAGREVRRLRREALARERAMKEAALAEYLQARRATHAEKVAQNLAALRPVECSEYVDRGAGPHGLGYRPEYAVDLDPETYWGADYWPQWLMVDLGEIRTIRSVRVVNYYGDVRYYHYRVEISTDKQRWAKVGEKLNDGLATSAGETYTFEPTPARYVRVTMLFNTANCGLHINELEVYP